MSKALSLISIVAACASLAGAAPVAPKITPVAAPVPIEDVRLLDGPFRDAQLRDKAYLLKLDCDRLLHVFRLNVGLPTTAQPYGGWENPNCEVRGHSVGHYLSACALMYAATGDPALKARADYIVAEFAKCQAAATNAGFHPGYLSAFPESFIDRVEASKPVWAPWYTLHKLMAGLLDAYQRCDNRQALDILVANADWIKFRVDRLTPAQMQRSLDNEHGGMNEVLANLYAVTGNPDHLRLSRAFDHHRVLDPLSRFEDRLNGIHANTQIPKVIGAAREYELTGDNRDRDIAQFFWERVALKRSYVIGGHSDGEHFFPIEQFASHLTPYTAETCNTYNMLKLTEHLFSWNPDAAYMEFYERALYNHILASQDPKEGMMVYLMSLKPGHFKTYSTPENSFWCCVGTGMENPARYSEGIYSLAKDTLYVNLYVPSELKLHDGRILRQETAFPDNESVRLQLTGNWSGESTLNLRCPRWLAGPMAITVNGTKTGAEAVPGSYVSLKRDWRTGDVVEFRLPMALHAEELPTDQNQVAFLYGPIVLAGSLGTDQMPNPYAKDQNDLANVPSPAVPVLVGNLRTAIDSIKPVAGQSLNFLMPALGKPSEISLVPFYKTHHQRYSVYWKLYSETGWKLRQSELQQEEAKRQALEARIIDRLVAGEQQPETDHACKSDNSSTGEAMGRHWRHATDGGWFSYNLKIVPEQKIALICTYWGGDAGGREFDILVDGQRIATQKLENNKPGEFFDKEYIIPANLTQGKDRITVKFQAAPAKMAGGLFECRTAKAE